MNKFDQEFVAEMFLDSDSITSMNRLVFSIAEVISENSANVDLLTEIISREDSDTLNQYPIGFIETPTNPLETSKMFFEETILNLTNEEYVRKFKMKKTTVQALIDLLRNFEKPEVSIVPLDKKVHIFLSLLTSSYSYSELGNLFGLHKSSVAYIFHEIALMLSDQRYTFINWPSCEEQHVTRIKVNSTFKFPNCVGFIDTCRFKVGSKRKSSKLNTIVLQAVCDESLAFIDIHVGNMGTVRKSKVFRESMLSRELKNYIHLDNHILGDSEYRLKMNLITPFSSDEVLTSEEMKFNEIHWKAHSYIGLAFELLKERFLKLSHIDASKHGAVKSLICAACVLHNFVLLHEGSPQVKQEPVTCDDAVTIDPSIVKTAEEKRQFLCNYICYIDKT